jgi:tyrosinase
MNVKIEFPGTDAQGRVFLNWTPVKATAKIVDGTGAAVDIILRSAGTVGGLVFDTVRSDQGTPSLALSLPANGQPISFWIAGEFQKPSSAYGDAVVQARDSTTGTVLGSKALMVRVRKNAQTLPAPERDRFLAALGTLNARGRGAYRDFRDMHTDATTREMHGSPGFLAWHRAYVLDLERALQAIDPTVALPYWRFDEPAPNLFTQDFLGEPNGDGAVSFRPGHALDQWTTDQELGITRNPDFDVNGPADVIDEMATMRLGTTFTRFAMGRRGMEIDPHGGAHVSFSEASPIHFIGTAVRDPLFFMLHANVDRLWAKWQWVNHRTRAADPDAFAPTAANNVGHHLGDTMWPWNGITGRPRPRTAPGGPFPATASTPAPGSKPEVQSMLDHLAVNGGDPLGYAYDDVPFELPPTVVAGGP